MHELKALIVKYETMGEELQRIVRFYNQQRSEEVIEDVENEIDRSHDQQFIYEAINESYLSAPRSDAATIDMERALKLKQPRKPRREAVRPRPDARSSNSAAISAFIQMELSRRGRSSTTPAEAAGWLSEAGLLNQSLARPDKAVRILLRAKQIRGQRQEANNRWFIDRLP